MDRSGEDAGVLSPRVSGGGGGPPGTSFKLGPPSSLLAQVSTKNHYKSSQSPSNNNNMYSSPPSAAAPNTSSQKRYSTNSPGPSSPLHTQHLPLALLSHIFTALLTPSPPRRKSKLPAVIPLPNFLLSLALLRSALSASSSSLSPREEVELRVLEGWVGLETGKVLLGEAGVGVEWREEWAVRGKSELRETEVGLGKGVSGWDEAHRCVPGCVC